MGDHRIFVGTEAGVLVYADEDETWRLDRTTLEGKRAAAILPEPRTHAIYAAVPGDGVYVAADGGREWDRCFAGDVRSLAIDPHDPAVVYAGTEPIGLFRSTDVGDHWSEVEALQNLPPRVREKWWFPVYPHEGHVLSIAVDHQDSRIVYLGLEHGGIVRTDDGGRTWEDISDGIEYLDIHMVESDPSRPNVVYAATARAFYRSEDFGRRWVLSEAGLDRDYMHDFVLRPGERSTLFMTTANGTPPAWLRPTKAEAALFRSADGGLSWRQLGGGLPSSMERMVWAVAGDPTDDRALVIGLGDYTPNMPPGSAPGGEVWRSPDSGDTWTRVCETPSPIRSICIAS
ncbi:MAG TPA: hypothetical protein VFC51_11460 [Chloroflexota bacterium]|nr:hypothetical protein [Chloroflexota bacterium]